jgi:large subunit ribosomal protein L3
MTEQKDTETQTAPAAATPAPAAFKTLVGVKVGMTQFFNDHGDVVPCTVLRAGPCRVTQIRTTEKDGYTAVQIGFQDIAEKKLSKPVLGQLKKAGLPALRWLREFRVDSVEGFALGQTVDVNVFKIGDYVDVQGTSKGKGFAGGVKRYHFRGGPATHGQSDRHRAPGSLTSRRSLGRVLPGKRMAGHMGAETVTLQKMEVVKIELENNLVYVCGGVPGTAKGLVVIHETVKSKKHRVQTAAKAGGGKKDKSFAAKAAKASAKTEKK